MRRRGRSQRASERTKKTCRRIFGHGPYKWSNEPARNARETSQRRADEETSEDHSEREEVIGLPRPDEETSEDQTEREEIIEREKIIGLLRPLGRLPPCDGKDCSLDELKHYWGLYTLQKCLSSLRSSTMAQTPHSAQADTVCFPSPSAWDASKNNSAGGPTTADAYSPNQRQPSPSSETELASLEHLRAECAFLAAQRDFYAAQCGNTGQTGFHACVRGQARDPCNQDTAMEMAGADLPPLKESGLLNRNEVINHVQAELEKLDRAMGKVCIPCFPFSHSNSFDPLLPGCTCFSPRFVRRICNSL